MRPNGMKLSRRHRVWFYGTFVVLFLSGVVWLVAYYGASGDTGTHAVATLALQAHGASAIVALVILGTLVPLHIKRGWIAKRNRGHGMMLIAVNGALVVSGYGLYYAGGEGLRAAAHWGHIVLGLALPACIAWHVAAGRASRPSRRGDR